MAKKILAIHKDGVTTVNPEVCKHENTVHMITGQRLYGGLGVIDTTCLVVQCMDCDKIIYSEEYEPGEGIPY